MTRITRENMEEVLKANHALLGRISRASEVEGMSAEDIRQEISVNLFKMVLREKEVVLNNGLLKTIARNAVITFLRKRRHQRLADPGHANEIQERIRDTSSEAKIGALYKAIAKLPSRQRTAVALRLEGKSFGEIAKEMGFVGTKKISPEDQARNFMKAPYTRIKKEIATAEIIEMRYRRARPTRFSKTAVLRLKRPRGRAV